MSKMRAFALTLAFLLCLIPLAPASAAAELNLPAGYVVLACLAADVTGDGLADTVYLAGRKQRADSPYIDDLRIIVQSGVSATSTTYWLDKVGGYGARLFAGDFSGDKVADVYVETPSGGSGGWSYHHIVSFSGNEPQEIFGAKDNQKQSISGEFVDGWKVELTNRDNGKTVAVDVRERRSDYLRLKIYGEDGLVTKKTRTMTAPFSRLEPVGPGKDGVWQLKGIQRISGAYRADGIADVETVLKYNGTDWVAQSVKVTVSMGDAGTSVPKQESSPR